MTSQIQNDAIYFWEILGRKKIPYLAIPSEVDLRRKQPAGGRGTYSLVRAPLSLVRKGLSSVVLRKKN